MHPQNPTEPDKLHFKTMCEVVSDEMSGQIGEMRSVLSTLMHLHFEGKKDELQQFCADHMTTINQISYFLEHTKSKTHHREREPIQQLFVQITSTMHV